MFLTLGASAVRSFPHRSALGVDLDYVKVDFVVPAERVVAWVRHVQDLAALEISRAILETGTPPFGWTGLG